MRRFKSSRQTQPTEDTMLNSRRFGYIKFSCSERLQHLLIHGLLSTLVLGVSGCDVPPRYNSLDLALLPCESRPFRIFLPVEFRRDATPLFSHQVADLNRQLDSRWPLDPIAEIVVFVHGWNKNPSSAELDYQNFLCRLLDRMAEFRADPERHGRILVVGLFWPSTITNRTREPTLLKPISYYKIRERADIVAEQGVSNLLASLTESLNRNSLAVRVSLVGHSFGGRMVMRSLEKLHEKNELIPFLESAHSVNVVLVNAAVPSTRFDWISEAYATASRQQSSAPHSTRSESYLFNLHSFNDSANRVLFRLASLFNTDHAACAAGACGVSSYSTLCIDDSGRLLLDPQPGDKAVYSDQLNVWNVDVTPIVFDHSDIYKGRVATLIRDLLYDEETRRHFPSDSNAVAATDARCKRDDLQGETRPLPLRVQQGG